MNRPEVSVLLATYNGQRYLAEQIDSIVVQSVQQWRLLIRDDGSTDDTVGVVRHYADAHPGRIKLLTDHDGHLGASLGFGRLLEHADTEYIMFSDQDDVWLPNKIELMLDAMKEAERVYHDWPLLVHTDLKVADSNLNVISDSMWSYQRLFPEAGDDLDKIMVKNVVTGCAMMINRRAKETSVPIPPEAVMHDWWIALNVARSGKIIHVPAATVLYRQHAANKIGAKKKGVLALAGGLGSLRGTLSANFRMLKKFDPDIRFWQFLWKKVSLRIIYLCW